LPSFPLNSVSSDVNLKLTIDPDGRLVGIPSDKLISSFSKAFVRLGEGEIFEVASKHNRREA
jgi:hypothetical protein